MMLRESNQNP